LDRDLGMVTGGIDDLRAAAGEWHRTHGIDDKLEISISLDMRYVGQNYELPVLLDGVSDGLPPVSVLRTRFFAVHQAKYGHFDETAPIEVVNVRLRASIAGEAVIDPILRADTVEAERMESDVWFEPAAPLRTMIVHRNSLSPGDVVPGPAMITQFDSTTIVPPACSARVDGARNIIIEVSQ